ncbi:hypothetical protein A3I18_02590 [Candidatus Campbellbacteria bacterium RIFCSPLOWO2_02_FULL_35_11]|uniref:Uncharacterized protein n=2 Tax=Candidatus Campbelliibacteriota TaxID=1752727 RepID=A0A1F5EM90_9BACT|nr:MAG: hypothetical protein A3E89_00335 [Candidatus Campbellbacteria bacterium RIFCSPHIGHO2_12_FULL_35_10]OGD69962.1 MAG: hypothetical protein A3I18_02590 [Candidatus Campbellbacteria bacterium RIFCSPLOWO2_02_FULL_35_11]
MPMFSGKEEKVFRSGGKMVYELGGDFFHCSFDFSHPKLKKLRPDSKGMETAVTHLGREKAREMNMVE